MRQTFKNILNEDLTPATSFLNMPVLIVWGACDSQTPLTDAYQLKSIDF